MDKAVILARGLGTRMRKEDGLADLSADEIAVANTGVKAMIPIDRPFLDYVISGLADAGYRHVCLVIGPEHTEFRAYYENLETRRVNISFAIQVEPKGTADAVLAAEEFAAGEPVLIINSDNYYPTSSLAALRELDCDNGLVGFEREGMFADSNISPERIAKFAVIAVDEAGNMVRIIEKPSPEDIEALDQPVRISMNCWRMGPKIYDACRSIGPSPRGELEVTDAVQYAIDNLDQTFAVVNVSAPVLDLTSRTDIVGVKKALASVEVNL